MSREMQETIRQAIRDSGKGLNVIASEAEVAPACLSLFMNKKRSLTLPVAEKVCKVVGLELRPVRRKGR